MTALADAAFYLPNTNTTVLTKGSGSVTVTRATTKNVFDNEGKLITVKSGARTFGGARCVQNLFSSNTDNGSGLSRGRITLTSSTAADPDGTALAGLYTLDATAGEHYLRTQVDTYVSKDINICFRVKLDSHRYLVLRIQSAYNYYDLVLQDWVGSLQGINRAATITGDGWVTLQMAEYSATSGVTYGLQFRNSSWSSSWTPAGTETITLYQVSMTDVTGQSDQTASEYISVGVLAAPYHGGGTDGVLFSPLTKAGVAIPDADLLGDHVDPESKTNTLLHCRDFTNAAWVKTNVTATKNQTGITGQASSCSLLEFTADGATVLQTIVAAAAAGCSGYWVKWHTAVGTIEFTRDNITWLDITSELSAGAFYVAKIENTSVTNPVIGFRGMNGGKIIVDAGLNHLGTQLCEPIFTTTASVTRNAEPLTYQTSGNFSDTAGTILATFRPTHDTWPSGSIVGKASCGLLASASNSGVQAADGTTTVSGPTGTPSGQQKIGIRWSGSSLQAYAVQTFGAAGSYDGSFNLTTIAINPGAAGYIRDVAVFATSLTNDEMLTATGYVPPTDFTNLPNGKHQDAPFQHIGDTQSSATHSYFCEAPAGTAPSAAGWRISSYEYATGYTKYADGNTKYDNIADNRASLTYLFI